jgi:hypothetical protein
VAGQQAQAPVPAHFIALFKQKLHAHTDAEKGRAGLGGGYEWFFHTSLTQIVNGVAKGPNAGQGYGLGQRNIVCLIADDSRNAHGFKGFLHVSKISYAVINDEEFYFFGHFCIHRSGWTSS